MAEYLSKKVLLGHFNEWNDDRQMADPIPDAIGVAIVDICTNLARRPNFSSYTYKDEMIADAIESCVKASRKFDVTRETFNPFGFFSRCAWWAFLRRIEAEHKASYIKHKSLEHHMTDCALAGEPMATGNLKLEVDEDLINKFEKKNKKK